MSKHSFVFYYDWAEQLLTLPDSLRLGVGDAIMRYVLYGEEPKDEQVKFSMFALIRKQLDRDSSHYKEVCQRRSEAAGKSTKKHSSNTAEEPTPTEEQEQAIASKSEQMQAIATNCQQKDAIEGDNDNVYENVNENENVNEDENDSISVKEERKEDSAQEVAEIRASEEAEREEILESFFLRNMPNPQSEVERFYAYYEAQGWRRAGGQPITNRLALARSWEPKDKRAKRFEQRVMALLTDWYKAGDATLKRLLLTDLDKVVVDQRESRVYLFVSDPLRLATERQAEILSPAFRKYFSGHSLHYRVAE